MSRVPSVGSYVAFVIRLIIRFCIFVVTAAIGLIVAVIVLPDMSISVSSFLVDVVIFAVLRAILSPFILKVAIRSAPAVVGAAGLISTLLALLITTWISDGLSIRGASTWVFATLIVWIASMLATLLIPFLIVRGLLGAWLRRNAQLDNKRDNKSAASGLI
ncbi:phage holin family protein [Jatrophihabitans sp. DSM 45814]